MTVLRLSLLLATVLPAGCLEAKEPLGPLPPLPTLESLRVEPDYGETGRTFITWSHPDGPNAIQGQPGTVRFTSRSASGQVSTVEVTQPFDSRQINRKVEFEYRRGRNVMEIRVHQQDRAGHSVVYDCFGPSWECFKS